MKIHKLRNNGFVVESFPIGSLACNCSILYNEKTRKAFIIDPGNDSPMILSMIQERALDVVALIHTHAHFDHIGHSNRIRKVLGSKMYLHKDDLLLYNM